jgi:hypothetical protein
MVCAITRMRLLIFSRDKKNWLVLFLPIIYVVMNVILAGSVIYIIQAEGDG